MGDAGQFYVDPDGLAQSADGFTDRAAQIDSASELVRSLSDPAVIKAAFGDDDSGQKPMAKFNESAKNLQRALAAFSQATDATGTTLKSTAKRFGATEDSAVEAGKSLQRSASDETALPRYDGATLPPYVDGQQGAPAGALRPEGGQSGSPHLRAEVQPVQRNGSDGQQGAPAGALRPEGGQSGSPHLRAEVQGWNSGSGVGALESRVDEPLQPLQPAVSGGQEGAPAGALRPEGGQLGSPHLRAEEKGLDSA